MLLPWISRSGPSLALRRATASAGSPTRRWLLFHVSGWSDDVTTCFRTALNVSPIGWSPLWARSVLRIVTIASNARLAAALSGLLLARSSARGVICHEKPQRSLHQPQALSCPPLLTMAFQ